MARYYHHRNESEDEQRHVPVDSECDAPGQTAYGDDADGKPDDTADGNALFFNQQPLGYLGEGHGNQCVSEHGSPAINAREQPDAEAHKQGCKFRQSGYRPQLRGDGVVERFNAGLALLFA